MLEHGVRAAHEEEGVELAGPGRRLGVLLVAGGADGDRRVLAGSVRQGGRPPRSRRPARPGAASPCHSSRTPSAWRRASQSAWVHDPLDGRLQALRPGRGRAASQLRWRHRASPAPPGRPTSVTANQAGTAEAPRTRAISPRCAALPPTRGRSSSAAVRHAEDRRPASSRTWASSSRWRAIAISARTRGAVRHPAPARRGPARSRSSRGRRWRRRQRFSGCPAQASTRSVRRARSSSRRRRQAASTSAVSPGSPASSPCARTSSSASASVSWIRRMPSRAKSTSAGWTQVRNVG